MPLPEQKQSNHSPDIESRTSRPSSLSLVSNSGSISSGSDHAQRLPTSQIEMHPTMPKKNGAVLQKREAVSAEPRASHNVEELRRVAKSHK